MRLKPSDIYHCEKEHIQKVMRAVGVRPVAFRPPQIGELYMTIYGSVTVLRTPYPDPPATCDCQTDMNPFVWNGRSPKSTYSDMYGYSKSAVVELLKREGYRATRYAPPSPGEMFVGVGIHLCVTKAVIQFASPMLIVEKI